MRCKGSRGRSPHRWHLTPERRGRRSVGIGYWGSRGLSPSRGGFAAEGVEERIAAVMRRPNGEIETPGGAARGGAPKGFGIGVGSEFGEADVNAVGAPGVRIGTERDDAGGVIGFDVGEV